MTTQDTHDHTFPQFPGQKRYVAIYATKTKPWTTIWQDTNDEDLAGECIRTLVTVPGVIGAYVYDRLERRRIATANEVASWAGPTLPEENL